MASFGDMARASKLCIVMVALCCYGAAARAQTTQPVGARVAELQFALARSLAQAGDHEAAAREFDRAFALQREAETATPAQTDAALQTLRAYVQSRPELPGIRDLGRRLEVTERHLANPPVAATLVPNAPLNVTRALTAASNVAAPSIVPNAPPSAPRAAPRAPATATPVVAARTPPQSRAAAQRASTHRSRNTAAWWDEGSLGADDLLIPTEWANAGLRGSRHPGSWPQLLTGWPALLIPEGWERPNHRNASMLLAETELLVPLGW